jgi:DNA-binding response OmpR family regulator
MNQSEILIIEDNPDSLKILAYLLRFHGYSVIEAVDGISALKTLKQESPGLVLLDILLPDRL